MIDFSKISSGLKKKVGIWHSKIASNVSCLEKGNDIFYCIEESSFWFNHRNKVLEVLMRKYDPGSFILDVGGGNGFVTKAIQDKRYDVCLIEPGKEGVINAKNRDKPIHQKLASLRVSASSLKAMPLKAK